jgi:uncharacterized membrane protein
MELCLLKFDGSHAAEDALYEMTDSMGDGTPWLHEVGILARPLVGRVRVVATFPDGTSNTLHEGDLADAVSGLGALTGYYVSALAGPLGSMIGSVNAGLAASTLGSETEQRLFRLDEVKKALPRDSSALALVADKKICDEMVETFKTFNPKVIRRDVADELRKRLETLHQRLSQQVLSAASEGASVGV